MRNTFLVWCSNWLCQSSAQIRLPPHRSTNLHSLGHYFDGRLWLSVASAVAQKFLATLSAGA